MADLHDLTALEQGSAVARGEVSPVELVDHYLTRVEAHDRDLGTFVTVTAELAREQAARLETEAGRGELRSPLHGVPVPVKDLTNTAGVRTTYGSAVYAENVPDVDDHLVTLLRAAGTVLIGKTNTPEFGLPCYTENRVAPPARTPWDLARMAGGSSGGAAAAVAAGLAPVAHGNDGGGSVRIPASCCGVVGLKPTRGRVSSGPLRGDVSGLPAEGVLARTVRDAAAVLDVLAVPMPGDPHWAPPLPAGETFLGHCDREPGQLRVGRFVTPVIIDTDVDKTSAAAVEETAVLLERLGHVVEEIEPPFGPAAVEHFEVVWSVLSTLAPLPPGTEHLLMPLTAHLRVLGARVTGPQLALALAAMQLVARQAVTALQPYDVVLTPTLAVPPLPIGALLDERDPAADFEAQKRFTPFTAAWNVTGMPAISLPLHQTPEGLPVGVMLAGRPAEEALLLAVAAQVEAAAPSPWLGDGVRPSCW